MSTVTAAPFLPRQRNSTSVRAKSLRLVARAMDAISPELGGAFAARLFFRTTRPPLRPEEAAVLERGRELAVPFEGQALRAWVFGDVESESASESESPTVLLVHGWSGRAGQMAALVDPLLARGARVVAFDAPAHGASPGRSSTIPEIASSLLAVRARIGRLDAIIAHSLGSVATTFALSHGLAARRIAYVAPPIDPERWVGRFGAFLELSSPALEAMRTAVQARAGLSFEAVHHTRLARGMTLPLLVLHDEEDREVGVSDGRALALSWPGARFERTRGLGHNRILRDENAVSRLVGFTVPSRS